MAAPESWATRVPRSTVRISEDNAERAEVLNSFARATAVRLSGGRGLYAGGSPSDTVPPRTAAAVPHLARPMMGCRSTVTLSALRAQSGGRVQNELIFREMVNGISALFAVMTPDGAVEDVNGAVLD
jgi:hypothetical protein